MAEKLTKKGKDATGIHPEVLKSLISQCNAIKSDMDEARGDLGNKVKTAEDTHGVHRKAFKLILSLSRMEDAPRADFLRSFQDYCAKLGFDAQGDLFDSEPDDDGDDGDDAPAGKVDGIEHLSGMKELAH